MNQAPVHTVAPYLFPRHSTMEDAVGVFWDHQSCPHPRGCTEYTVIQAIRALALASGSIKQFNIYVELEPYPRDKQSAAAFEDEVLRKELHASGISLLECPTISAKTTADTMMIVDILAFALQNRLPTTLVIISADIALAYGISLLRQRHFKVILITSSSTPANTATALRSQSDISFTWEDVLAGKRTAFGDLNVALSLRDSPASQSQLSLRAASEDRPLGPMKLATDPILHVPATPSQESVTIPSESYVQASPSLRPTKPARSFAAPDTSTKPTQTNVAISIEHLYEVIDLLVKAVHERGWPLPEIQKKVGSSPKMGWKKTNTVAHLEEGVRLGLLVHTVSPPTMTRSELHYYAVEGAFKSKWIQGVPDPIGFLRAETNLPADAQKEGSAPASLSVRRTQGDTYARATNPSLQVMFANEPPTSEPELVAVGASSAQPQVPAGHDNPDTSEFILKTNTTTTETKLARINNPKASDVPVHLRDIVDVLIQATSLRGWPQELIGYYLPRRDGKRWKDSEKVLAGLEESVQLGLLVSSVSISKTNKNFKTYYAVEDGLKKSWPSRKGKVGHLD